MRHNAKFFGPVCLALLAEAMSGQTTTPNAGLIYIQSIAIPTWTTSGTLQANYDLFAFNPATRIMYLADRTNHAIDAIDTRTNSYIGSILVPGGGSPNGVLIALDLQQLVVTDGKNNVFVYDLRIPSASPDQYVVPNIMSGTDALDYDPLNQRVYVANTNAPYYLTAIDLAYKTVATQYAIPYSPELLRFNPNDGLFYLSITDGDNKNQSAGLMAYDPVTNNMKALYLTPGCVPHGVDLDPVTNTALMGCSPGAQVLISLKDGTILKSFPDITGTDLLAFSPSTRRFYIGAGSNTTTTTACGTDSGKAFPIIGVVDAQGPVGPNQGRLIGVTCSGRAAKGPGVDPFQNFLYVAVRQYPIDPADANTGAPGILVYYDPVAPPALTTRTQATMTGTLGSFTVNIAPRGRGLRMDAALSGITGKTATINVTTTVGYESVACGLDYTSKKGVCGAPLLGDPLIGGVATLAVDGVPVAFGTLKAQ